MEGWRRWCLGAVALLVLAMAFAGLDVRFSCPAYHPTEFDRDLHGGGDGYHVVLATAGAVGVDGLLLGPARVDTRDAVPVDGTAGLCTAVPDVDERGLLPREPGTYWWQPYRDCATYICPFGEEVGDPVRVVVRETVCSADRTALRAATHALAAARKAYTSTRTAARRARVTRLAGRVTQLRARLRVVYHCKM